MNKLYCDICETQIKQGDDFGAFEYIEKKIFAQYKKEVKEQSLSAHKDLCGTCMLKVKKALDITN